MTSRERLANRRASTTFNFKCGPHHYTATVSYFPGTDQLRGNLPGQWPRWQ